MHRTHWPGVALLLLLAILGGTWQMRQSSAPGAAPPIPANRPPDADAQDGVGQPRPNNAPAPPAPPGGRAFGTDIRITTNSPGRPHNEPFVAADPLNPLHLIAGSNEYTAGRGLGFWYTADGGVSWQGGSVPGPYPGGSDIQPQADPTGDIDAFGNSYFASLGFSYSNTCRGGVYVLRSTDGGQTFATPVQVVTNTDNSFADKVWFAANKQTAGAYAGWLYVTYTWFEIGPGCSGGSFSGESVQLRYSSDHGQTWSPAVTLPQPGSPVPTNTGTHVVVAADGTVYVAYNHGSQFFPTDQQLYVTRSTDGGQTFGAYYPLAPGPLLPTGYTQPGNNTQYYKADESGHGFRAPQFPILGVSPADSHTLYAVWNAYQADWDTTYMAACCQGDPTLRLFNAGDIAFARSTDDGVTWTAPQRLNDDPLSNGRDQFLPWLAVSPNGALHVTWDDRRDDPANRWYHVYYTHSTDGGQTWSPNERVSDVPSDPGRVLFGPGDAFLGDYGALAANDERVLPVWTDGRAGLPAGEQQLYTDPLLLSPAPTTTPTAGATSTPSPTPTPPSVVSATATASPRRATPTATPCAVAFSDVHPADYFAVPVGYLACRGVISGYADGTFRPYNPTTRGQMVKIVVLGFGLPIQTPTAGAYTFSDAPPGSSFFAVVETAAARGIVGGYTCGGPGEPCDQERRAYFRPNASVTRGQLSKIAVGAAGWALMDPPGPSFADVAPGSAFYPFVETAVCHGIVSGYACGGPGEPCDAARHPYFRPPNPATRGQIAKIVYLALTGNGACPPPVGR